MKAQPTAIKEYDGLYGDRNSRPEADYLFSEFIRIFLIINFLIHPLLFLLLIVDSNLLFRFYS